MSDLKKYISKRKKTDGEFAKDYDQGFENFKIGFCSDRQENAKASRKTKSRKN